MRSMCEMHRPAPAENSTTPVSSVHSSATEIVGTRKINATTATSATKKGERIRTFQYGLLPFLVVLVPLVALIFLEPNLSMAVLVTLLAEVVLFTAGERIGHLLRITVVATTCLSGAVALDQFPVGCTCN